MKRPHRFHSRLLSAPSLHCEPLEQRLALSNLVPSLESPVGGSTLTQSPTTVVINFNEPIDPNSLSSDPTSLESDVQIYSLDSSGNQTPLIGVSGLTATEALDPNNPTKLDITLSQPLSPGNYEVAISTFSAISALNGDQDPNLLMGDDDLGSFTIVNLPTIHLGDASLLPTPGPTPLQQPGVVDLSGTNPAVQLYRFTTGPATSWEFGAQVLTSTVGSTLAPTLALFDSSGNLLDVAQAGPAGDPNDPFLFDGLSPGTYYLGISDHNNVPGTPSGYNLQTGFAGSLSPSSSEGNFTLEYVATANPRPTVVTSLSIDHADPLSSVSTGFTIGFSGALDTSVLPGDPYVALAGAFRVVNQQGVAQSITLESFNEQTSTLKFAFNSPLAPGIYTIETSPNGGLVDLNHVAPRALNQPAGVLGKFVVVAQAAVQPTPNANSINLSVLFPGSVSGAGFQTSSNLPTSQVGTETYRFVIVQPGTYQFWARLTGSADYSLLNVVTGTTVNGAISQNGQMSSFTWNLPAGPYYLTLTSIPSHSPISTPGLFGPRSTFHIDWGLVFNSWEPDAAIALGIDPGAALNLRLISANGSSTSENFVVAFGPTASSSNVETTTASSDASNPTSSSNTTIDSVTLPSLVGISLTIGGNPIGRPSASNEQVPSVGPSGVGTSVALAAASGRAIGINQGVGEGPELGSDTVSVALDSNFDGDLALTVDKADRAKNVKPQADLPTQLNTPGIEASPSEPAAGESLVQGGWLDRLTEWFADLAQTSNSAMDVESTPPLAGQGATPWGIESGKAEHATAGSPFGVGVAVVVALQARRRIAVWLGFGGKGLHPKTDASTRVKSHIAFKPRTP